MDRRIVKTQTALLRALKRLMSRCSWEEINVQKICREADVSRSTFYAHFSTKQDLLEFSFDQLEMRLDGIEQDRGLDGYQTFQFLPRLLRHIRDHREMMKPSRRTIAGYILFNRFRVVIYDLVHREIRTSDFSSSKSRDDTLFLCGGLSALIEKWNESGCALSQTKILQKLDAQTLSWL